MSSPFPPLLLLLFSLLPLLPCHVRSSCHSPPPCPPFRSSPSFPFSLSPGCGHPSFQIRCSSANTSRLTINSYSFDLLHHSANSLLLSPSYLRNHSSSSFSLLPASPIDLSGSPFRFSTSSCARLSSLPRTTTNNNCTKTAGCSWQRRFLSNPLLLLRGCRLRLPQVTEPVHGHEDFHVRGSILTFLRSGVEVHWNGSSDRYFTGCSECRKTTAGGSCGFNDSEPSKPFLCFKPPSTPVPDGRRRVNHVVLLGTTLFAIVCLFALAVSAATVFRRSSSNVPDAVGSPESAVRAFLRRHQFQLRSPVYSYEQLQTSTDGFDPRRKIGDGGFGSVYLARMDDGQDAAVKRLHRHHPSTTNNKSFCNEILILSSIHHPNLVRLHGYCCDPRGLLIVYDYVPNGTLADHLHGSRSAYKKSPALTWPVRVDIALQTASALEYLHFSVKPPVVHRDITSTNIFVEKDMTVKVGDFGLSRLLSLPPPNSCRLPGGGIVGGGSSSSSSSSSSHCVWTGPQGTPGYLDPDYHHSFRLTEKSDVYSFGVVLLELLTGMKAVDVGRDKSEVGLADMVVSRIQMGELHKVVDPVLLRQEGQGMGAIEAVAELAFRCLAADKDDRPDSRELVEELKRIRTRALEAVSSMSTSGAGPGTQFRR